MNPTRLNTRLAKDSAQSLTLIAAIAASAGLSPAETARIDQLAATKEVAHSRLY